MECWPRIAVVIGAYLAGAVPFGVLIARARGVDIRKAGSGNIGATNVGRVLGRPWGMLVFACDFLKGLGPTLGAAVLAPSGAGPDAWVLGAGMAAVLGHVWPVYLGFRGGKGVATGAGVLAALAPAAFTAALGSWLLVLAAWRYVSLASLLAAAVLVLVQAGLWMGAPREGGAALTGLCLLVAMLVFVRHRGNIRRLRDGSESRVGGAREPETP